MKLYLSCDRTGCCPEVFAGWVGTGGRVAVIANALDLVPDEAQAAYARNVFDPIAHFGGLGLRPERLDLRAFFGRPQALEAALAELAAVWLTGGESFLLLRALRASGADGILQRRVRDGSLVYGGWSAGAIVASVSLRGAELMDNRDAVAEGYPPAATPWEGLGLIEEHIVPHYRSDHAEGPAAERMAALYEAEGRPFVALGEGDVLLIDGARREIRRAA